MVRIFSFLKASDTMDDASKFFVAVRGGLGMKICRDAEMPLFCVRDDYRQACSVAAIC